MLGHSVFSWIQMHGNKRSSGSTGFYSLSPVFFVLCETSNIFKMERRYTVAVTKMVKGHQRWCWWLPKRKASPYVDPSEDWQEGWERWGFLFVAILKIMLNITGRREYFTAWMRVWSSSSNIKHFDCKKMEIFLARELRRK